MLRLVSDKKTERRSLVNLKGVIAYIQAGDTAPEILCLDAPEWHFVKAEYEARVQRGLLFGPVTESEHAPKPNFLVKGVPVVLTGEGARDIKLVGTKPPGETDVSSSADSPEGRTGHRRDRDHPAPTPDRKPHHER